MILHIVMLLIFTAVYVFSYHYQRNGYPLKTDEFLSRAFWSLSYALGVLFISAPSVNLWFVVYSLTAGFVAILVPHEAYMNMGRWPTPQRQWPAFFLPLHTQAKWDTLTPSKKLRNDIIGMGAVGLWRGLIAFAAGPLVGLSSIGVLSAMVLTTVWQPFAYWVGWKIPVGWFNNTPKSAMWGEFLIGVGWALAVALATWL
ncbi:MAG: hypothetical protein KGL39_11695 [Patescibacteria group bacterium]|nr:hypothetical protein [Patescibacteria group bacterium]